MVKKLNRIEELNKNEPWTKTELNKYSRNIQFFIRGIQIQEGKTKDEAISYYHYYMHSMPKAERQVYSKKVHKTLISKSPDRSKRKHKGKYISTNAIHVIDANNELIEENEENKQQFTEQQFSPKFKDFNDWFLNSKASEKTRNRIIKNHQQNTNASLKQLYGKKQGY